MTAYLIYNRQTPTEGQMTTLKDRLEQEKVDCELIDADSPRGIGMVEAYDLMARPAVVLMRADGTPVQTWQGDDQIPPVADISYLAHQ